MTQDQLKTLITLAKICTADQTALPPERRDPDFPGFDEAEAAITAAEATLPVTPAPS